MHLLNRTDGLLTSYYLCQLSMAYFDHHLSWWHSYQSCIFGTAAQSLPIYFRARPDSTDCYIRI